MCPETATKIGDGEILVAILTAEPENYLGERFGRGSTAEPQSTWIQNQT